MPTSRVIARLLTTERDCNSAEALRIKVAVETASPALVAARNLLDRFRAMIAAKKGSGALLVQVAAPFSRFASVALVEGQVCRGHTSGV